MIKILIVDDEQIEREGMQAILTSAFPDSVIKQALNGKMAVDIVKDFHPDLVLMDIKMPEMDGLEAVKQIQLKYPHIKFIMVTAYDTFDYVRQAIKLGVKDYLLKPSKVSEIKTTIGKVIGQIEEERTTLQTRQYEQYALQKTLALVETDVVTQLLFDHVHEVHLDMLVEMLDIPSTTEMFVVLVVLPPGSETKYSAVKSKVRKWKSGWVGALYAGQLPIIVFRDQSNSFRSQAIRLARDILSLSDGDLNSSWFVGIGSVCTSLDDIRQSYQDSLVAVVDTNLPVKYRFFSDVPVLGDSTNEIVKQMKSEFSELIRLGNWEQVRLIVNQILQTYENEGADLLYSQQRMLEILWIASRILTDMGVEIEARVYNFQTQDYRQLRGETDKLLDQMRQLHLKHFDRMEADTVQQIKLYILEHSHQDISLDTLAKKVGLSPIYISKIFKEKIGVNYIDFLTECRIEKAKKLMGDHEKSIKEITYEVGYHEPNYFSKVFKKMCKLSPKEYRKALLGKRE